MGVAEYPRGEIAKPLKDGAVVKTRGIVNKLGVFEVLAFEILSEAVNDMLNAASGSGHGKHVHDGFGRIGHEDFDVLLPYCLCAKMLCSVGVVHDKGNVMNDLVALDDGLGGEYTNVPEYLFSEVPMLGG
jgi:hypothetical protein